MSSSGLSGLPLSYGHVSLLFLLDFVVPGTRFGQYAVRFASGVSSIFSSSLLAAFRLRVHLQLP